MVTTRRGKTTAAALSAPSKAKSQSNGTEAVNTVDGSHAVAESNTQQQHKGKKRGIGQSDHAPPSELPKRQKKVSSSKAKVDLQVKPAGPLLEEKAGVPEADTFAAAAAVDPPAGSETAISAEDMTAAATEEEEPKLDVTHTSEMPVSEAVKIIGGTHAGSAPVSEAPTAGKALDSVPVGPDPAAAAPAADDTPQDGDYFLDATLADSKQGNEEAKPAGLAHPVPATEDSMDNDQTGMAADVAPAALTDVPTGVHADKAAAAHLTERTGTVDTMHEAITTAPTTVDTHDSHFGAAAGEDAADVPAAIYGGDNA
ncbi:hypothetical protein WJX79_008632 [Trebouxia sp. C0005]